MAHTAAKSSILVTEYLVSHVFKNLEAYATVAHPSGVSCSRAALHTILVSRLPVPDFL